MKNALITTEVFKKQIFKGGWQNNSQNFANDSHFGQGFIGWESFFQKMADFGSRPSKSVFIFLFHFWEVGAPKLFP
jgi:hypothetical protein